MTVEFLEQFETDLDRIRDESLRNDVFKIISSLESARSLKEVRNVKKLKGYRSNYRIRIRDYRIGFKFEGGIVELARILHRKEIYRFYP
jgi:mRNA interferase RelE/StbE